jgi:hypothetical protein
VPLHVAKEFSTARDPGKSFLQIFVHKFVSRQPLVVVVDSIAPFLKAKLVGGILFEPALGLRVSVQVETSNDIVKGIPNDVYDFFHKIWTVPNRLPLHSVVRTDSLKTEKTLPEELARGYNVRVGIERI